jgi:hypothetical protein
MVYSIYNRQQEWSTNVFPESIESLFLRDWPDRSSIPNLIFCQLSKLQIVIFRQIFNFFRAASCLALQK